MGLFKSYGKMLAYPYLRVVKDLRDSAGKTRRAYLDAKALRARKRQQAEVAAQLLSGKTPQQKFEELVQAHDWTEDQLAEQMVAVRRTRMATLVSAVLIFVMFLVSLASLPFWVMILAGPLLICLTAAAAVAAMRYAWYEYELETRSCVSLKQFLGREDIFARAVRLKS